MINAFLRMLTAGFTAAVLVYSLAALAERQWDKLLVSGPLFVAGVVMTILLASIAMHARNSKRYDMVRQQRLVAPAIVNSVQRKHGGEDELPTYAIAVTVYPPDMPPYQTKFDRKLDPITDAGTWQKGAAISALLSNPDDGSVDYLGRLQTEFNPGRMGKEKWEHLVRDYIQGGAPTYRGPVVPGVEETAWRSLQVPDKARLHPFNRPLVAVGTIAGLVIGALLCQTSLTNTVQRLLRGELSPVVYKSSVMARTAAQDALNRSGADEFYSLHLNDTNISAYVPSDESTKVENWRTSLGSSFFPGQFAPWTDADVDDRDPNWQEETFGIDDVNWEALPKIAADGHEYCADAIDSDFDLETVDIAVQDGQLQFEYYASMKNSEHCNVSYTMDGKPIGL